MKTGIELIADERKRQVESEGWTADHDDFHAGAEMADAAAVYADAAGAIARGASPKELHDMDDEEEGTSMYCGYDTTIDWPWEPSDLKLSPDPIRNLVKAGALIAAEIDRLQRIHRTRCPCSFEHPPHDFCDGNPGAKFGAESGELFDADAKQDGEVT